MKKLRVLHILNSASFSGAENVVITIINKLQDEIEGIYLSIDGPIGDKLESVNIKYYRVDRLTRKNLRKAIFELKPDIIHAHDFRAGILSASLFDGIPIINHLHNNSPWLKKFGFKSVLYALSTLRYKKILTVSNSVMDEFIFSDICKNKSQVVGNPIDLRKIEESINNKNICENYEIAFLGRLTAQKNPIFFLEIICELKKIIPCVQVRMIGDGELKEQVQKKIKELNLQDNIKLLGFKKNPYEYLFQAKILCMPSAWEGFGLAAVEALALGKPVVAAPVGGLVNIINTNCGMLCMSLDDYVAEISNLLLCSDVYMIKSQGAFERAFELNNIDSYMNNIMQLYRSI